MKSSSRRAVIVKKPEGSGSGTRRYLGNLHHKGDTPEVTKIVERAMLGPGGPWAVIRERMLRAMGASKTPKAWPDRTVRIIEGMRKENEKR